MLWTDDIEADMLVCEKMMMIIVDAKNVRKMGKNASDVEPKSSFGSDQLHDMTRNSPKTRFGSRHPSTVSITSAFWLIAYL